MIVKFDIVQNSEASPLAILNDLNPRPGEGKIKFEDLLRFSEMCSDPEEFDDNRI
jgi:hypothetical protein